MRSFTSEIKIGTCIRAHTAYIIYKKVYGNKTINQAVLFKLFFAFFLHTHMTPPPPPLPLTSWIFDISLTCPFVYNVHGVECQVFQEVNRSTSGNIAKPSFVFLDQIANEFVPIFVWEAKKKLIK